MSLFNLITDPYDRSARLYPAFLVVAPGVATVVALLSKRPAGLEALAGTAVGLGGAFLLAQLGRDRGKAQEPGLFQSWGGMPSVAILRHSHKRIDSLTKARYHSQLSYLVKGGKAPTIDEEEGQPAAADEVYSAWSHYLRVNTRDKKKYQLLFQENVNYGYRRNVWGLRPLGILVSAASALLAGGSTYLGYRANGSLNEATTCAAVLSLLFLGLWLFRFSSDWVRLPADAYAERLLETLETLGKAEVSSKSDPAE